MKVSFGRDRPVSPDRKEAQILKRSLFDIIGLGREEGTGLAREHDKILYRRDE